MFSGFKVSRGGFFSLFLREFRDKLRFLVFFANCLMQKCEYVVPEQCIFTLHSMQ